MVRVGGLKRERSLTDRLVGREGGRPVAALELQAPDEAQRRGAIARQLGVFGMRGDRPLVHLERLLEEAQAARDARGATFEDADPRQGGPQPHARVEVGGLAGEHLAADGDGLVVAGARPLRVAQVGHVGVAEDVSDAVVAVGQLHLQRGVALGVGAQPVQVGEPLLDDRPACGRGAGEVLDLPVDVDDEGPRQLPDVGEAPVGSGALQLGDAGLAARSHDAHHQAGRHQTRRRNGGPVPAHELPETVARSVGARQDRQTLEVAPEVLRQLLSRGVAALRLLPQRLQHDRVQVPPQLRGRGATVRPPAVATDGAARRRRLRRAHRPHDVLQGIAMDGVGRCARQQLVEHHSEGVDVRGGRHGLAATCSGLA